MITEEEVRQAVEVLASFYSDGEQPSAVVEGLKWIAWKFAKQELDRREAEQIERAKPITVDWCKANGGTGTNDQQWWKVAEGEWLRVTFYERGAVSVSFRGRKLYGVQTVGSLKDLLNALKGTERPA